MNGCTPSCLAAVAWSDSPASCDGGVEQPDVPEQAVEDGVGVVARVRRGEDRLEQREGAPAVAVAHGVHEIEDARLVVRRADGVDVLGRGLGAAAVQGELLELALEPLALPRVLAADVEEVLGHSRAHRQALGPRPLAHPARHLVLLGQVVGEHVARPWRRPCAARRPWRLSRPPPRGRCRAWGPSRYPASAWRCLTLQWWALRTSRSRVPSVNAGVDGAPRAPPAACGPRRRTRSR